MRDEDVVPVALAERQHEEILVTEILPTWTRDAVPQDRPVVVVVAGPAGSGKSELCGLLRAVLDRRGGAVVIGRDLYKTVHPAYGDLMRSDDRTAGVRVRPDVLRWQAEVEEYVRHKRFDVVLETPVADPEEVCATARSYRAAGYRIELVALATAEAVAQLSAMNRYLTQVSERGVGRYVSWATSTGARATCRCSWRPSRPGGWRTRSWSCGATSRCCTAMSSPRAGPGSVHRPHPRH
ncbi:zeta toxin family protein [Streptomyces sp. NPDC059970]|uniref:zeta toxin family protein n=1 Tax=Streptomyces sp. NPDC059970 TaxID=3347019 RepID=UPI003687EC7D